GGGRGGCGGGDGGALGRVLGVVDGDGGHAVAAEVGAEFGLLPLGDGADEEDDLLAGGEEHGLEPGGRKFLERLLVLVEGPGAGGEVDAGGLEFGAAGEDGGVGLP